MKFEVNIEGQKNTIDYLKRVSRNIKKNTPDTLANVAAVGQAYAQTIAPKYTGDLSKHIVLNFPEKNKAMIVSMPGTNDGGFPINVLFDEDRLDETSWGSKGIPPRDPNSIGFMKKTKDFLEKEFSQKLNLAVERSVK